MAYLVIRSSRLLWPPGRVCRRCWLGGGNVSADAVSPQADARGPGDARHRTRGFALVCSFSRTLGAGSHHALRRRTRAEECSPPVSSPTSPATPGSVETNASRWTERARKRARHGLEPAQTYPHSSQREKRKPVGKSATYRGAFTRREGGSAAALT
jgi:hypothetical protein